MARSIGRRPALPSGRAVVGGLLVAVAMVAAFALASGTGQRPAARAVVARRAIAVGQRLEADDLQVVEVDLPPPLTGRTYASVQAVIGGVTLAPLDPDDLVLRSAVLVVDDGADGADAVGPGTRSFSFPVERERALGGHLRPGESVDVLATYGTGETARTAVVATGVRLLDVDERDAASFGSSGGVVVTVALDDAEAVVRAAHATQVAAITLVRSTGAAPPLPATGTSTASGGTAS